MRVRTLCCVCALTAATLGQAGVHPLAAQAPDQSRMLRQAAALESQGDYQGAQDVLLRLLAADPTSSGGLFALERVLRANGTTVAILPSVDAFLAGEPESSGVRYLKLRVLAEVDSLDALRDEAELWFTLAPATEVPYREVSRVFERAFGTEEAIAVLRRGRRALDDDDALALELGDLLVATDPDGAIREWGRAVGVDGAQVAAVVRRVAELPPDRRGAARDLVESLGESDLLPRRRAGAEIALSVGFEDEALVLSREVCQALDGRARASFLTDVARRARDSALPSVAAWAYQELGSDATTPAERRQFDQRMVEVSLSAGDTVAALEAQQRLASSYSPGSADRRRAVAGAIRLESATAQPARLSELLDEFRAEFPQAPELDDIAATVASGLLARDDPEGAAAVLEGIEGPRSSMERAYLLLDVGDYQGARTALLIAATGLAPETATQVIQFVSLLQRLSPEGSALLAEAGVLAHQGQATAAARAIEDGIGALEEEEQPPLLAEASRMADRGGAAAAAAGIRRQILADFPDAPEVEEASLALARYSASAHNDVDGAIRILEELIAGRPNAAVVPDARRELERLRSREER